MRKWDLIMIDKSKKMDQKPENNKNPPKDKTTNEKDDEIRNKLSKPTSN